MSLHYPLTSLDSFKERNVFRSFWGSNQATSVVESVVQHDVASVLQGAQETLNQQVQVTVIMT